MIDMSPSLVLVLTAGPVEHRQIVSGTISRETGLLPAAYPREEGGLTAFGGRFDRRAPVPALRPWVAPLRNRAGTGACPYGDEAADDGSDEDAITSFDEGDEILHRGLLSTTGLLAWLTSTMLNERNISPEDLSLIHLTDSPKDAVDFIIKTFEQGAPRRGKGSGTEM